MALNKGSLFYSHRGSCLKSVFVGRREFLFVAYCVSGQSDLELLSSCVDCGVKSFLSTGVVVRLLIRYIISRVSSRLETNGHAASKLLKHIFELHFFKPRSLAIQTITQIQNRRPNGFSNPLTVATG
jgi:hypothetical protein